MNSETKSVSYAGDRHPEENHILLALERELSPEESTQVEQHLGTCWSCRARSEEMQRGILAFVEYREKRYLPLLDGPPHDFSGFPGRLRTVLAEKRTESLVTRMWKSLARFFTVPGQLRWVSVVSVAMSLVLFWVEVLHPPSLSADQLLTRAIATQNPSAPSGHSRPARIAHQKVLITTARHTVIRDFQWIVGSPIQQSRWEGQHNPVTWNTPFTAEGFAGWRASVADKNDTITRNGDRFTLFTTSRTNTIREAWLIVRAADFHPLEQHLRFSDQSQMDIVELSFEIREQAPIVAQNSSRDHSKPGVAPGKQASAEGLPSTVTLDEAELQLRYTLFKHQWDIGEDLNVTRTASRIVVSGTVSSQETQLAMQLAMGKLPNVQLSLRAPDMSRSEPPTISRSTTARPAALLKQELERAFPILNERQEFVDRCLSESDNALAQAWALKRLAERYDPSAERQLVSPLQRTLRTMVRGHLQQLRQANRALTSLEGLLPGTQASVDADFTKWQEAVLSMFAHVQQQDRLVTTLLVGTRSDEPSIAAAAQQFRSAHQAIEAGARASFGTLQ